MRKVQAPNEKPGSDHLAKGGARRIDGRVRVRDNRERCAGKQRRYSADRIANARRAREESATLVQTLAAAARPSLDNAIEIDTVSWQGLVERERVEDYLSLDAGVAVEETIRRYLPDNMQREFTKWCDSHTAEVVMVQRAAFEVGVAVGLTMRGGVR